MDRNFEPPTGFFNISQPSNVVQNITGTVERNDNQRSRVRVAFSEPSVDETESKTDIGSLVTQESTTKKKSASKFSMSSFVKPTSVKKQVLITEDGDRETPVETKEERRNDDELIYTYNLTGKTPYVYGDVKVTISNRYKRALEYSNMIADSKKAATSDMSKKEQRELEEKVAQDDVMDMFGSVAAPVVDRSSEDEDRLTRLVNEALSKLNSSDVVVKKDKNSSASAITADTFFGYLYDAMAFLNAEEKGLVLNREFRNSLILFPSSINYL